MDVSAESSYRERFPSVEQDRWLPAVFDATQTGMAERFRELAPVYSYAKLVQMWDGLSAAEVLRNTHALLAVHPRALVMHRPARETFWRRVETKALIAWELMTPAIIGVAAYGAEPVHAVVYDRSRILEFLAATINDGADADPRNLAIDDYRSKMLSCNAGRKAPWYFFY